MPRSAAYSYSTTSKTCNGTLYDITAEDRDVDGVLTKTIKCTLCKRYSAPLDDNVECGATGCSYTLCKKCFEAYGHQSHCETVLAGWKTEWLEKDKSKFEKRQTRRG